MEKKESTGKYETNETDIKRLTSKNYNTFK
jgi:hypothetical protein